MRLGIINNITPAEEESFGEYEYPAFVDFFAQTNHEFELIEYRATEGDLPRDAHECDGYLLTGSPKGVYDSDGWISELAAFVRAGYKAQRKLVGICFGHQMLAHALGGQAEKSPRGWGMGRRQAEIVAQKTWMTPALKLSNLYYCHQDQVLTLPPRAELLGRSEFCPNMMFVIGDQVLATQAHPEFKDDTMMKAVASMRPRLEEDFLAAVTETIVPEATDGPILAQWIVNFLRA